MLDFLFHWPPRMLFGVDSHKKIGEEMQGVSSKALIVCAKGPFRENGLYDDVKNSLERAGIQTYGMGDIDQNPRLSSVREGVAICKKETIDTVVAIGGGSAMDCTKLIAAAFLSDRPKPSSHTIAVLRAQSDPPASRSEHPAHALQKAQLPLRNGSGTRSLQNH